MDYKEFVYNDGKDIVGISAQSSNILDVVEQIGWDVVAKDYENLLLSNNLSMLFLTIKYQAKEDPTILRNQFFGKLTVEQKDILVEKMKQEGFELEVLIALGPQTEDP